jgi:hypothetical protein
VKKQDSSGGPAFPQAGASDESNNYSSEDFGGRGMTLRDFFAAHALSGLIAQGPVTSELSAALAAYRFADEMLVARQDGEAKSTD